MPFIFQAKTLRQIVPVWTTLARKLAICYIRQLFVNELWATGNMLLRGGGDDKLKTVIQVIMLFPLTAFYIYSKTIIVGA